MVFSNIHRNGYSVLVTVRAKSPVLLGIRGIEKNLPQIVYFERWYGNQEYDQPFVGTQTFLIPVPIKPEKLRIDVYDRKYGFGFLKGRENLEIVSIKTVPLEINRSDHSERTIEFLEFAELLSLQSSYLHSGTYKSANGNFTIHLVDTVLAPNGTPIDTVASVRHDTGEIQIRKNEFDTLTVANKIMILCHEYAHYNYGVYDEISADQIGVDLYKSLGYSNTEAIMTLYHLFHNDLDNRIEKENRVESQLNYIYHNYEYQAVA